ncbi:MAG: DUF4159 domain-containing protein [Gemmatimonadetes bacterium]|nr:DUF4159 domain-containing protein [Gemmatimonadota bacterium]
MRTTLLTAALVLAMVAPAAGQRGFGRRFRQQEREPTVHNLPYDGSFTFARIAYVTGPGGYYYMGLPAWAHGYPRAGINLMKIMDAMTLLRAHKDGTDVFTLDDPELFKYPVAYMTEAGYWTMTDQEAKNLHDYLLKGGFVIFDDFRDDFRNDGWGNFARQMRRVLPNAEIVDLTPDNPIFHSFFDIPSFDVVPQYYDRGKPVFRGIYEDNDPTKRLMVVINFNTDISNFWEFSDEGYVPVDLSNEAYKLGVDYIIYALTH